MPEMAMDEVDWELHGRVCSVDGGDPELAFQRDLTATQQRHRVPVLNEALARERFMAGWQDAERQRQPR